MKRTLLLTAALSSLWLLLPLAHAAGNDHAPSLPARSALRPFWLSGRTMLPQQAMPPPSTATPPITLTPSTITTTLPPITLTPSTITLTPSTITPTPSTITPTSSNATPVPSSTIAPPTPVTVDFSVDQVAIQSTSKKRGKALKKTRTGAKAYVAIYWTLRRAPAGSKPTTLFFGTLCKKTWKTGRVTGRRSSYPPTQYYAALPITLEKAGTYRIAGGVDIHGTMRAAGAAVTVGGKHC